MPHICTSRLSLLEDTCTLWNVEIILCEKKPVCTVLGISSCGWGFKITLVEASIYEAHCSFLRVLHQPLVLALLGVAPPPVVLSEQTSINIMSWMWRRPFLGHPIRDRCRTYAATDAGSPPRATSLPSFGNLEPVRKEQFIYLFIWSTPPSSQQKAIIKGGKKIGKEWERIEELNETFLQYYIYVQVWEKKLKTHVHTVNAQKSLQCHVLKGGLCWL